MRNWADLNTDCLINIFTRVGLDDTKTLINSVQFVCKSWFRATCDPCCWETLNFSELCCTNDVIFAVQRSQGCATTIMFDVNYFEEILPYIIEGCPLLKALEISGPYATITMYERVEPLLTSGLSKWKNLETFKFTCCSYIKALVEAIGVNCKNFIELDFSFSEFFDEDIQAVVTFLPQLKLLTMTGSNLYHHQLVAVLTTCKDLEFLDVSYCRGFVPDDEIYRLASHIKHFSCDNCWTSPTRISILAGTPESKVFRHPMIDAHYHILLLEDGRWPVF